MNYSNVGLSVVMASAIAGVSAYSVMEKKDAFVSVCWGVTAFAVLFAGMQNAYPMLVWVYMYYMYAANEETARTCKMGAMCFAFALFCGVYGIDYRWSLFVNSAFLFYSYIVNGVKLRYMSLNLFLCWVAIAEGASAFYMVGYTALFHNYVTFTYNKRLVSMQQFKKYYLKHPLNYQYVLLSLGCPGVEELLPEEKSELVNFIYFVKGDGMPVEVDPLTYAIAYSNIKNFFGSDNYRVENERSQQMSFAADALKRRVAFPFYSNSGRVYECRVELCENLEDMLSTVIACRSVLNDFTPSKKMQSVSGNSRHI